MNELKIYNNVHNIYIYKSKFATEIYPILITHIPKSINHPDSYICPVYLLRLAFYSILYLLQGYISLADTRQTLQCPNDKTISCRLTYGEGFEWH